MDNNPHGANTSVPDADIQNNGNTISSEVVILCIKTKNNFMTSNSAAEIPYNENIVKILHEIKSGQLEPEHGYYNLWRLFTRASFPTSGAEDQEEDKRCNWCGGTGMAGLTSDDPTSNCWHCQGSGVEPAPAAQQEDAKEEAFSNDWAGVVRYRLQSEYKKYHNHEGMDWIEISARKIGSTVTAALEAQHNIIKKRKSVEIESLQSRISDLEGQLQKVAAEAWAEGVDAAICATDGVIDTKRIREAKSTYLSSLKKERE
jgi:hypothetical protein